jgi:predicted Zn-dependent protease with MMP-like domain
MSRHWPKLLQLAQQQIQATLSALPDQLRRRAAAVAVTMEPRPNRLQRQDGVESDTLGLFVGPDLGEEEHSLSPLPPQIILFLENILEQADGDETLFREEIRTTYLHELGHYLGLNEQDLTDRGLE